MAIPTDPNHPSDPTDRLLTSRGLSAREIEIARLLADGHTNPEMAAACTSRSARWSTIVRACSASAGSIHARP